MSLDTTIRRARPSETTAIKACVEAAYEHYIPRIEKLPGPMLDDYSQVVQQHQALVIEVKGQVPLASKSHERAQGIMSGN